MDRWSPLGISLLAAATAPTAVVAAEYLTVDEAARQAFPAALRFEPVPLRLTAAQIAAVNARAGVQPRRGRVEARRAVGPSGTLGWLVVDEVVGRQELITYAVAIDAEGRLGTPEVLASRESHGAEIRSAAWRRQFAGRSDLEALRFRTDIKNIAGATLSSEHVTQGVRFALALWQVVLRDGGGAGG